MIQVLMVDDDPTILDLTKIFLERLGDIHVDTIQSAREAMEQFELESYDVIVSDYMMPEMDGITFLKSIRNKDFDIPFILFTGKGREEVVIEALNNGADYYLQKDNAPKVLYAELSHQIRQASERQRTKIALQESEKRYRSFVQNFQGIAFRSTMTEPVGSLESAPRFVHGMVEEITGYTEEEFLAGTPRWFQMVHPDDLPRLIEEVKKTHLIHDYSDEREYRILRKDGEVRWVHERVHVIRYDRDEPFEVDGTIYDVTDRKRSEEQMLAQRDLARRLSGTASLDEALKVCVDTAIRVSGMDCGTVYLIDESSDDLKLVYATGLSKDFSGTESALKRDYRGWLQVEAGNSVYIRYQDTDLPFQSLKVREGLCTMAFVPILHQDRIIGCYSIGSHEVDEVPTFCRDVMETIGAITGNAIIRIQAVEALRTSHKQLLDIIEFLPDATFVIDRQRRVIAWNLTIEKMTGARKKDILGKDDYAYGELFYGFKRPMLIDTIFSSDDNEIDFLCYHVKRDGEMIFAEAFLPHLYGGKGAYIWGMASPLFDAEGNLVGAIESICDVTELKQAEKDLRETRDYLDNLLHYANAPIAVLDNEMIFVRFNRAFERLTGYTADEIIGKELSFLLTEDGREEILGKIAWTLDGELWESVEVPILCKNGDVRMVLWNSANIYLEDGETHLATIIQGLDITERKLIEKNLREEKQRFQTYSENAPFGMVITEKDGTFSYINSKFKELFGYDLNDISNGKEWFKRAYPDPEYRHQVISTWIEDLKFFNPGEKRPRTFTVTCKNGNEKIVKFVAVQLENGENLTTCEDISELKQVEAALRKSEERLNLAIEAASLGTWDLNLVTGEVIFNGRCAEMLGYSQEKLEGHLNTWEQLIHPEDLPKATEALQDLLDGRSSSFETEHRLKSKEGRWIWIRGQGKVVFWDEMGRPIRMVGIIQNVTEMRRYQDALKEANKRLNLLSSITRHDMLNQISGLSGYAQLLSEIMPPDPKVQQYIGRVRELTDAIRQQVAFTRDYQDMGINAPAWQDVEKVVRRAATKEPLDDIRLKIATGPLEIFADPMLEKVFFNLIENSVLHGEGATEIRVSFHGQDGQGIVVFEDDGVGIPAEMKSQIFEQEFGKHTGYGLFLAKEILGITGMEISEIGEKGARFEIKVPIEHYKI